MNALATFPIVPAGRSTQIALLAIGLVIAVPTVALLALPAVPNWVALPLAVPLTLIAWTGIASRKLAFEVTPEGLRIRGSLYKRLVPREILLAGEARSVDLDRERELQPTFRLLGTGLPGFAEGWFWQRGRAKALLFLTDPHRAVLLPTRAGYSVLLSVADPAALIAQARTAWGD